MPSGVNDDGHVVGWSYTSVGVQHAFFYSCGGMIDVGTLGGSTSVANGLNNFDQVSGYSYTASAFLYNGGKMSDLGTLGGSVSYAFAINGKG